MKKLIISLISISLTLSMVFVWCVPVFASEPLIVQYFPSDKVTQEEISPEEIVAAREAYNKLSPEEKRIFDESLADDPLLLQFHLKYVDSNYVKPAPRIKTMAAAASPLTTLAKDLSALGLPSSVLYALKAMGAGIVAAVADGPLPVGDIILIATTATVIVVVAANWDKVEPKLAKIEAAFKKAFSKSASNISSAFSKIKKDAKKEADKKKGENKKPTGNRVRDVQNRLKKEGFINKGQTGSHQKWNKGKRTVMVPNNGPNYEIPIGTLRSIWRQAGWI